MNRRRLSLFSVYLTFFVDMLCWAIVFPIFPPFFLDANNTLFSADISMAIRTTILGLFLMAFSLGQFLGAPIIGEYADRNGRKKALSLGVFFTLVGVVITAWSMQLGNLYLLFGGRLLTGLFASSASVCLSCISDLSLSEKSKMKNFGYFSGVAGASFLLGAFFGGKLSDHTINPDFHPAFPLWLAAGLTLVNFLFVLFGFKETSAIDKSVKFHILEAFHHIKMALRTERIKAVYSVYFLFLVAWAILFQFISVLFVEKFHFTNSDIGDLAFFMGVCWMIGSGYLNKVAIHHFKANHILEFCLIGFTIFCTVVIFPKNVYLASAIVGSSVILGAIAWPICVGLISSLAPKEIQGKIFGITQSIQSLALTLAAVIGGLAFHENLGFTFLVAAGISLSTVILYFILKRQRA